MFDDQSFFDNIIQLKIINQHHHTLFYNDRILMQRGLRINPKAADLWLEVNKTPLCYPIWYVCVFIIGIHV